MAFNGSSTHEQRALLSDGQLVFDNKVQNTVTCLSSRLIIMLK